MALEVVDLYVSDDTVDQDPVAGVVVRFYQQDGYTYIQQATTDVDGHVSVLLDAPATYQARFYKFQVSILQPQALEILLAPVAPDSNRFDVTAHIFSPPEALDARFCRCSGFFRNPDGSVAANVDIQISPKFSPLLLDGSAMLAGRTRVTTDQNGYGVVDLVRFGQYDVQVEGMEDWLNEIAVPDQSSVNLPDLLFAVVDQITFDPAGPYSIPLGGEVVVTPTIYWSDGNVDESTGQGDVQWSTGNDAVAVAEVTSTTLVLRGIGTGTTNLLASRIDTSILRIPATPIVGVPVTLSVA